MSSNFAETISMTNINVFYEYIHDLSNKKLMLVISPTVIGIFVTNLCILYFNNMHRLNIPYLRGFVELLFHLIVIVVIRDTIKFIGQISLDQVMVGGFLLPLTAFTTMLVFIMKIVYPMFLKGVGSVTHML